MIDFKKNAIPVILIAFCVINLFLVLNKERTFSAASAVSTNKVTKNRILMYDSDNKLIPSAVTCSDAGDLGCKKLKVGDVKFDFSNAQQDGIVYLDDEVLRISAGVTCKDDGTVECKKLKLGDISLDLNDQIPGTLVYDSQEKKVRVSAGAKVTTDNKVAAPGHIAIFEADKGNAIKPSKFKIADDATIDNGIMVLDNGVIKPEPNNTYLKFDKQLPGNIKPGTVIVHGEKATELTFYKDLCFDLGKIQNSKSGDLLYIDDQKRISAKGKMNFVTNNSGQWQAGHLLLSSAESKVCELSSVKFEASVLPNQLGEYLIVNENNVLKPILTTNLLRAENPYNVVDLDKRVAMFKAGSSSAIVPSQFTVDFNPNEAANVDRALVLTEMNKLTLKDIKTYPVATLPDTPLRPTDLAIYNPNSGKLEKSGFQIDLEDDPTLNQNKDAILTIRNKIISFTNPPVVPNIVVSPGLDNNKNYIPLMSGSKDNLQITVSDLQVDKDTLIIPSGEIKLGDTKITTKLKGGVAMESGMYLVYDDGEDCFSPKKPTLSGIDFKTPIKDVTTASHLVLDKGKWDFREYSHTVKHGDPIIGTDVLEVTLDPKVVPGLEYQVGKEKSCVIFAECVAAFKGAAAKPPVVCFHLKQGAEEISRKYYVNVQSVTFPITNYVSIFQVVDTSTKKDKIEMMVNILTDQDAADKTSVNMASLFEYVDGIPNNPEPNNGLKCRMYVRKVF